MYCFCNPVSSAISLLSVQTESTEISPRCQAPRNNVTDPWPLTPDPCFLSTIRFPMHPARIAELLQPFVGRPTDAAISPDLCHSEERSDEEPAVLSPAQLHHISTYINILLRWNARINLTAIRDSEEIVTRHFGESLFAARHLFPAHAPKSSSEKNYPVPSVPPVVKTFDSVADLGSGAGFP